jgi:tRNA/rRNA methyltransferase
MSMARTRVVLVRTHYAGNLGSVARVMRNFGLTDLVLVTPYARTTNDEAQRMATDGKCILDSARIVETLSEALADCQQVIATSAIHEGIIRNRVVGSPEEVLSSFNESLVHGPCALVFGPEPTGLNNDEIMQCHGLMYIPTVEEYSALNLAQAVAISLYELRKQWLKSIQRPERPGLQEPMPSYADQERMFANLRSALEAIHFVWGQKGPALFHCIHHLISRAKPRFKEVKVLFGLARQLHYVARQLPDANLESEADDSLEDFAEN